MSPFYEDLSVDSRDNEGHYCGQSVETGEFVESSPDKMGYCGPHCTHCVDFRVYAPDNGVWACAADNETYLRSLEES